MWLLLVLPLVPSALAADSWSTPHPGVELLTRTSSGPREIYVAKVDLCERGVSVRTTTEDERGRTTSSFRSLVGADLAVNGDFFDYSGYWPIGFAMGAGSLWSGDNTSQGFVAFGWDHALITPGAELWSTPGDWMSEAVAGYPLMEDGSTASPLLPSHCSSRHPRTAVGLSWDRQTLILAVVDGRSSSSIGMTCTELAELMDEMGAYTALNLDGGGSSAMSSSVLGTVNSPSDGSERTVSNHIALHLDGTGAPESCDFWADEVITDASVVDGGSTDVDGDGRADACARGAAGLTCYPSTGSGFSSASWLISDLSNAAGFDDEDDFPTLRFGDLDGDGLSDVCARGDEGVTCWRSTGSGFSAAIPGPPLTDAGGWYGHAYTYSLRLADFDGDGRDDVCARAASGLRCYPSTGHGFGEVVQTERFSDESGWSAVARRGTMRFGDVDGDGLEDVCGRSGDRVYCAISDGAGFPGTVEGPEWSDASGWSDVRHWSTIRLVDLDGDGLWDLCGRSASGVRCHLSRGTSFGPELVGPELSDATGWADHSNYSTMRFGDMDADGDQDLCIKADIGMFCYPFEGSGFTGTRVDGPAWSDAEGWDDPRHYATITMGDVDGDHRADLCGRGPGGVECWLSDGAGFPTEVVGPEWSDAVGWAGEEYYTTMRLAGVTSPEDEPVDTGDTGDEPVDTGREDTGGPVEDSGDEVDDTGEGPDLPERGTGGCLCQGGGGSPSWVVLPLVFLLAARRRRVAFPPSTR